MKKRKDRRQSRLQFENLEDRRCLAASVGWDGPGTGSAELTYYIDQVPASVGLSLAQVENAIETALDAWSDVVDVNFTQVSQPNLRDSLDFEFASIDGGGRILAQAYFPDDVNSARIAGDVQFDVSERWEIGNAQGRSAFDLTQIAVHEIGHSLGLAHINGVGAVLNSTVSASSSFTSLDTADRNAALELYAPATNTDTGTIDNNGNGTTNNDTGTNTGTGNDSGTGTDSGDTDTGTNNEPDSNNVPDNNNHPFNRWFRFFRGWFGRQGRFNGFGGFRFGRSVAAAEVHQNWENPEDVTGDGNVNLLDAYSVVRELNSQQGAGSLDVNGDGRATLADVMAVINRINRGGETTVALQERIDRLQTHIATGELPERLTPDAAIEILQRLRDRLGVTDLHEGEGTIDPPATPPATPASGTPGTAENSHGGGSLSRLATRLFNHFDANDDDLLTEDELPAAIWNRIVDADTDASGGITTDELVAFRDAQQDARIERRFNRRDDNGDGFLTADEVYSRVWDKLAPYDADQDNQISLEEYLMAVDGIAEQRLNDAVDAIFQRVDDDGDEMISEGEVGGWIWRRLDDYDTNADSLISRDEVTMAIEERYSGLLHWLRFV